MIFRKKKELRPDYAEIARLERELGLDDETVLAPKKRELRGPVLLNAKSSLPAIGHLDLVHKPGHKWIVNDHDDIRPYVPASSVMLSSGYGPHIYTKTESKVVLPVGVSGA